MYDDIFRMWLLDVIYVLARKLCFTLSIIFVLKSKNIFVGSNLSMQQDYLG